jgi:hypothetical protein
VGGAVVWVGVGGGPDVFVGVGGGADVWVGVGGGPDVFVGVGGGADVWVGVGGSSGVLVGVLGTCSASAAPGQSKEAVKLAPIRAMIGIHRYIAFRFLMALVSPSNLDTWH